MHTNCPNLSQVVRGHVDHCALLKEPKSRPPRSRWSHGKRGANRGNQRNSHRECNWETHADTMEPRISNLRKEGNLPVSSHPQSPVPSSSAEMGSPGRRSAGFPILPRRTPL